MKTGRDWWLGENRKRLFAQVLGEVKEQMSCGGLGSRTPERLWFKSRLF